jgi:RNA polymerase sigma-70 factor (ECF subfamily)
MTLTAAQLILEDLPDSELARHIGRGEPRAFELAMRRNNQLLYRTARSILRDDNDAEDCVQEAYLQAFRAIDTFRGESKLSTWLTRIVINQALERMRKRKREDADVSLENVLDIDSRLAVDIGEHVRPEQPEALAMREEVRELLERHIDKLPAAFRTVFVLRALEEFSVEETAASLGIPEATVRTRFFRARSLLRDALERQVDLALGDAFSFDGARCDRLVHAVLERVKAEPATGPPT